MIISIDGPAGSGKSTIAKNLADKLKFIHFNSGSLYRAITVFLIDNDFDISSISTLSEVPNLKLDVEFINGIQNVSVNKINYTKRLRDNEVSIKSAVVSTNKKVRETIWKYLHKFAEDHSIVMDGRDIGSIVFPNADYKFYLDCSVEERARRRFKEEQSKNTQITLQEIEQQIRERDIIDKNKVIAPLIIPENAIVIDSTNLSIDEIVNLMLSYIKI